MRIVLDTNTLVSGMLNPRGAPGRMLDMILGGFHQVLYDDRILEEYADVLTRSHLGIPQDLSKAVIAYLRLSGEQVTALPLPAAFLPDPDDLPFLEVAISGKADALVTGNIKHFPLRSRRGIRVLSHAAFLQVAN